MLSKTGKQMLKEALLLNGDLQRFDLLIANVEGIIEYELGDKQPKRYFNKRKYRAIEIGLAEHIEVLTEAFDSLDHKEMNRAEMVNFLCKAYDVGKTKVEQKGGFLNFVMTKGLVVKTSEGIFKPSIRVLSI